MPWGVAAAAVGGGLGLLGSSRSASAARDAARAARPRPFNFESPFGNANFRLDGMTASGGVGSEYATQFSDLIGRNLAALRGQPVQTIGAAPFDLLQAVNGSGMPGQTQLSLGSDLLGADFMTRAQQALQNSAIFDIDSFAGTQFDRLNRISALGEETAASGLADRLFSRGRLGANDTAAGRAFGELDLSQRIARDARLGQALGLATTESQRLAGLTSQFGDQAGAFAALGQNLRQGNQQQLQSLFGALRGDQFQVADFGNQLRAALLAQSTGAQTGVQNSFAGMQQAINNALSGAGLQSAGNAQAAQFINQAGQQQGNFYAGLGASLLNAGVNYAMRPPAQPTQPPQQPQFTPGIYNPPNFNSPYFPANYTTGGGGLSPWQGSTFIPG